MNASNAPRMIRCPGCGGPSRYSPDNAHRPFCSERCKRNDFGAWASGSYSVGAETESKTEPVNGPEPGPDSPLPN